MSSIAFGVVAKSWYVDIGKIEKPCFWQGFKQELCGQNYPVIVETITPIN
jgi:hypothetical protein